MCAAILLSCRVELRCSMTASVVEKGANGIGTISIVGILRLRAIKHSVCDRSAKRFAQDDGLVGGSKKNIRTKLALMGVHKRRRIPYRRPPCTQSDMSFLTMFLVRRFLRHSLQNLVGKTLGVRVEGFLSLRGRMGSHADHTERRQRL